MRGNLATEITEATEKVGRNRKKIRLSDWGKNQTVWEKLSKTIKKMALLFSF